MKSVPGLFAPSRLIPFILLLVGGSITSLIRPAHADIARPLSSGIVYPSLDDAVANNSAALTDQHGLTAGRLDYDPNPALGYSGMFATSSDQYGYGLSLNALGAGTLTLGAGMGGNLYKIGVNASLNDSINPSNATFGLSGIIGGNDGFRLAATLSSVLQSEADNLTVGIGYSQSGKYQVEVDLKVLTSSFTSAGLVYTLSSSAVKYFGTFGLGVFENSLAGVNPLGVNTPNFGGVLQYFISNPLSIDLRYSTGDTGGFGFGLLTRL